MSPLVVKALVTSQNVKYCQGIHQATDYLAVGWSVLNTQQCSLYLKNRSAL